MNIKFISIIVMVFGAFNYSSATTVVDPWIIDERQAISHALLNSTRIPALFGEDNFGNILWGLEIQRQWQVTSGRQQSKPSIRIDETAWFSGINYFLTVVPYLAAMKSNLIPSTKFLPPQSNLITKFPITYETIDPDIAQNWTNYFEIIKILQVDSTYLSLENLQRILWTAHDTTVTKVLPTFEPELQLLNVKERKFANGFGNFVQLIAIVNLNSSYPTTNALNQLLFPQRVLREWDAPPFILDMTLQQNVAISTFFFIDAMTQVPLVWSKFVDTFRIGMATAQCAIKLLQFFIDFLYAPKIGILDSLLRVAGEC